ncbi:MAG: hypothetical protein E7316_01125 [Clostridiales bacterium]|nr:hypothetical protein [Clostridiales bacterium]
MLHHILVKWKEAPADAGRRCREVEAVFQPCLSIPGVQAVKVVPNVIHRPNRYDMLIVITMDEEALPLYDACEAHHRWKDEYGGLIEKKAIFDCE